MVRMTASPDTAKNTISSGIYGHFSEHLGRCIYGGLFVGKDSKIPNTRGIRNDVAEALRSIKIPVLRWPGGCFADEYHWMDGIGPLENRKKMINTHWGGVVEDNSFGTHEFLDLCEQLGTEPYICGNLGSGTVREMQEWVEYITFGGMSPMSDMRKANGREEPWKLKYFAVGNENWGCGGNMTAEYYANEYRRYATYLRNFDGNRLYKVACGPNVADYHWTEVLMREAGRYMSGLALHSYTFVNNSSGRRGSATDFGEDEYLMGIKRAMRMEELVTRHSSIMDMYDPYKRIGLIVDEWGIWTEVEPGTNPGFLYQQNSLRDALIASVHFDIFNKHSDRVHMANIAQTVNVLQSVVLTDEEKMLLTPTYYAFRMYNKHHNATYLPLTYDSPAIEYLDPASSRPPRGRMMGPVDDKLATISATASLTEEGLYFTVTNSDPNKGEEIELELFGREFKSATAEVLTAEKVNSINTFEQKENVVTKAYDGFSIKDGKLVMKLEPKSITAVSLTL